MTIRVDEVCFWYAEEGPAELKTSQVDGRAKSLEGYTISDLEDLVKRVRAAYKIKKVEREDLLIWDKLAHAWVEVSPELDLSTFVVRFGTGDKSRLTLCVGLRPVKKDGLEVEVFQSGLDYIHSECGQLKELVACALNSIRSDAIRAGRSVPAHFQHYTSPAFKLRLGFNPTKLNDLNFNVDSEKVTVIHRYGAVALRKPQGESYPEKTMKGGVEAKLNPAKFEASSNENPYSIESLRELGSGEENETYRTYRRDERRLLVIAVQSVQSNKKEELKQLVKLEVGKALKFKEDSGPLFMSFAPLRELGFSMARLMEMVPFRLRSYLQTLLCADSPERAEKGCVIVTDGSSDCSWCQIFPASCLDSETETICCVPCVLQYYPHKVKEGLFDDETVRTIATSGLQEFWHAWAWILQHSKPTGFLNELQLKRLKTRLQVLENSAITCHLSARVFFANALVH